MATGIWADKVQIGVTVNSIIEVYQTLAIVKSIKSYY
jgi:hypothetical protein